MTEPILLTGYPLGSSMGLVAAFEWLGEPYRLARVKMPDEMLTEAYRRLNGRQETPVLVTETGQVVTETMAIALWLEARDPERRISFAPGTPAAHRMHQMMAFLNTGFTAAFGPYWVALEMAVPDPAYQAALRRFGQERVNDRHARLEAMLGDTPYLLGERPTLADAVFVGVARWAAFHESIDPAAYPRVAALRERLEADPAVRFAIEVEAGRSPRGSGAMCGERPLAEVLARLA